MYGKSITGDSNSSILSNSEYYITASHMMSSHTTCPWCPSPPLPFPLPLPLVLNTDMVDEARKERG